MKHIVIGKAPPLVAALAMIAAYDRRDIETAIDEMIARLDARDGDPDIEPNGDEHDSSHAEDDFGLVFNTGAIVWPGCPISDPGEPEDDFGAEELGEATSCESFRQAIGAGLCANQQDDDEPDDPAARQPHIKRIRRTRCRKVTRWHDPRTGDAVYEYRLPSPADLPTVQA